MRKDITNNLQKGLGFVSNISGIQLVLPVNIDTNEIYHVIKYTWYFLHYISNNRECPCNPMYKVFQLNVIPNAKLSKLKTEYSEFYINKFQRYIHKVKGIYKMPD